MAAKIAHAPMRINPQIKITLEDTTESINNANTVAVDPKEESSDKLSMKFSKNVLIIISIIY